jgi:hypothetical protein
MKRLYLVFIIAALTACSSVPPSGSIEAAITQTPADEPIATATLKPALTSPPEPANAYTSQPTITLTAEITPTNTPASPTATKTPSIPDLQLISHHGHPGWDGYHIMGEIQNNSDTPMAAVKITAILYSREGGAHYKESGTDYTYTLLDVIPAKGKAPFDIGPYKHSSVKKYYLQVQGEQGNLSRQDIVVLSDNFYTEGEWLHIRGEIKNTGTTEAEFVKVVITLYGEDGRVVGVDYTYTTLDKIPAGGVSSFESRTEHGINFDHYEIQVQGK